MSIINGCVCKLYRTAHPQTSLEKKMFLSTTVFSGHYFDAVCADRGWTKYILLLFHYAIIYIMFIIGLFLFLAFHHRVCQRLLQRAVNICHCINVYIIYYFYIYV